MGEFYLPLTFLLADFLTEALLSFAFLGNGFFVAVFFGTRGVFFLLLETFLPGDFLVFSAGLRVVFSFAATFFIFGLPYRQENEVGRSESSQQKNRNFKSVSDASKGKKSKTPRPDSDFERRAKEGQRKRSS